jgi:hypothetical protein
MAKRAKNKFCQFGALRTESDVEQFFLSPLFAELGYGPDYLETKATIKPHMIGKGRNRRRYFPDYIGHIRKAKDRPVLIGDAKHPDESADDGVDDSQLYASVIRRALLAPKPDQYCLGSNGRVTSVKHYDSNQELLRLGFEDFLDGNAKFEKLRALLSRQALANANARRASQSDPWIPVKASVEEIKAVFQKCHNRIWKRESLFPTAAFYFDCWVYRR